MGTSRTGKVSAGILLYRGTGAKAEVLLVHPGGPFWAKKDDAAWSIPKGLVDNGEDTLSAARREFEEETDAKADGPARPLGAFKQPSGKTVEAWAVAGAFAPETLKSNMFEMEWPPRSAKRQSFPEVDRAAWFDRETAMKKIVKGQQAIIEAFFEGES